MLAKGLSVKGRVVTDPAATIAPTDLVDGSLLVLRSGKKAYRLVRLAV